jgi:GrpB-like predicted nucleotidyltransferase (UPF0157 family)
MNQPDPIIVVSYDPAWSTRFRVIAAPMRAALGSVALRIDHIGSTAVPGLAAKPIIDVQISVQSFEPFAAIRLPLEQLGYLWQADNPDLTKRYFRESPGAEAVHIHVRLLGSWSEQYALLFRDYLRANETDRHRYGALKLALAERYRNDREAYQDAKSPLIWEITRNAHSWTWAAAWQPAQSDI